MSPPSKQPNFQMFPQLAEMDLNKIRDSICNVNTIHDALLKIARILDPSKIFKYICNMWVEPDGDITAIIIEGYKDDRYLVSKDRKIKLTIPALVLTLKENEVLNWVDRTLDIKPEDEGLYVDMDCWTCVEYLDPDMITLCVSPSLIPQESIINMYKDAIKEAEERIAKDKDKIKMFQELIATQNKLPLASRMKYLID